PEGHCGLILPLGAGQDGGKGYTAIAIIGVQAGKFNSRLRTLNCRQARGPLGEEFSVIYGLDDQQATLIQPGRYPVEEFFQFSWMQMGQGVADADDKIFGFWRVFTQKVHHICMNKLTWLALGQVQQLSAEVNSDGCAAISV